MLKLKRLIHELPEHHFETFKHLAKHLNRVAVYGDVNRVSNINNLKVQGPVVQSIVSLTSSLVVKMLTILVIIISNSQVFLLKNVNGFCKFKSYSHFFSKNISIYAILNDQSFNDKLTNDIVYYRTCL